MYSAVQRKFVSNLLGQQQAGYKLHKNVLPMDTFSIMFVQRWSPLMVFSPRGRRGSRFYLQQFREAFVGTWQQYSERGREKESKYAKSCPHWVRPKSLNHRQVEWESAGNGGTMACVVQVKLPPCVVVVFQEEPTLDWLEMGRHFQIEFSIFLWQQTSLLKWLFPINSPKRCKESSPPRGGDREGERTGRQRSGRGRVRREWASALRGKNGTAAGSRSLANRTDLRQSVASPSTTRIHSRCERGRERQQLENGQRKRTVLLVREKKKTKERKRRRICPSLGVIIAVWRGMAGMQTTYLEESSEKSKESAATVIKSLCRWTHQS